MGFLDLAFLPSCAGFPPHCVDIVVDVKTLEAPHV